MWISRSSIKKLKSFVRETLEGVGRGGSATIGESGWLVVIVYFQFMYSFTNNGSTGSLLWCARVTRCFHVLCSRYRQLEYLWEQF